MKGVSKDRTVKVEWVDLGEGISGDYNPNDPEDVALLRFDGYLWERGEWVYIENCSYCTRTPVGVKEKYLRATAAKMADAIAEAIPAYNVKMVGAELSWMEPGPETFPCPTFAYDPLSEDPKVCSTCCWHKRDH